MISNTDLMRLANTLEGTCDSVERVAEKLEINIEGLDIEDELLNVSCERCEACGYWAVQDCEPGQYGEPLCSSCYEAVENEDD